MSAAMPIVIADAAVRQYKIQVDGNPVTLPRARAVSIGGKIHVYTPKKVRQAQQKFKSSLLAALQRLGDNATEIPLFREGIPVKLVIQFHMRRPKDHFMARDRKRHIIATKAKAWPSLPDIDNLGKFVLDAGTGILYDDDKQVAALELSKKYGEAEDGKTTIHIEGSTD